MPLLGLKMKGDYMKKLYKNWFVHNCIAHPVMHFVGVFDDGLARKIHDGTLLACRKEFLANLFLDINK